MGWVRLDDDFTEHRKVLAAGPLAGWLWVCAIAWSNRNGTNGRIQFSQVPRLVNFDGIGVLTSNYSGEDVDPRKLAEELVDAGLFEPIEGGYLIHDYDQYQLTVEEMQRRSDAKRRAGQAGGKASAQARGQASAAAGGQAESKPNSQLPTSDSFSSSLTLVVGGFGEEEIPDEVWQTIAKRQLAARTGKPVADQTAWLRKARTNAKADMGERARQLVAGYRLESVNELADVLLAPTLPTWLNGVRREGA